MDRITRSERPSSLKSSSGPQRLIHPCGRALFTCLWTVVMMTSICGGIPLRAYSDQHFVKRPALCPALHSFMDTVFKVAVSEKTRQARLEEYGAAIQRVMTAARRHFGPFWDPRPFRKNIMEYVQHQEWYRRPPDGWDPKASRDNILLFSDIARGGLRIDLDVLSWCEQNDPHRHEASGKQSQP